MNDFLTYLPDFAHALWTTLYISLAAAAMGALVGFGLNSLRLWLPLAVLTGAAAGMEGVSPEGPAIHSMDPAAWGPHNRQPQDSGGSWVRQRQM